MNKNAITTATPVNKTMFAIKGRNVVIIAPLPAGCRATANVVDYMRVELKRIGAPKDLAQVVPALVRVRYTVGLGRFTSLVTPVNEAGRSAHTTASITAKARKVAEEPTCIKAIL